MNFIRKIFEGKIDESVHLQFQKFSKGEFLNRALINAKKTGQKYVISTSTEFANGLVEMIATKLGEEKTLVRGAIVSTSNLKEELKPKEIKQFQGVKKYIIEKEMSGNEILNLIKKFPKAFFALSFSTEKTTLKIKPKAPKSGKPGSKGEEKPKADFCKIITSDDSIGKDFIFEFDNFKKADIYHTFLIEDLIKPIGETDFAVIRELAKRKGKIIREINVDGKKVIKEIIFEA